MMDSISICSYNVNGIRNTLKRKTVFRQLRQKQYDFICLQETFILDSDTDQWEREWGGKLIHSTGTRHSKGQIILQKKGSDLIIHKEFVNDRILSISFDTDKGKVFLINAYAPNVTTEKQHFYNTLDNYIKTLEGDIILCGDFNCVMSNELDIISGDTHRERDVEGFKNLVLNNSLNDTWRLFNPSEKEFSWCRKNPFIARRLDYIFTSDNIFNSTTSCNLVSFASSDHRIIEIKYRLTKIERGPSYWKFNNSLLHNLDYIEKINKLIDDYVTESVGSEPQFRWDICKIKIREFTIDYSKERKRLQRKDKEDIDKLLNELDIKLSQDPLNVNLLTERENVKQKLEIHNLNDARSAQTRSRVKFIEEGEKNTKYFLGLEKARANAKVMDTLTTNDGHTLTSQTDILKEQVKFYSTVYEKKREFDLNQANNFCRDLNIPKISNVDKNNLDKDISIEELGKALSTMKNDSAPGNDGLTNSFYKVFWNKIKNLIFESFNASYHAGELSFTQRQAIITLIHKGKDLPRDSLSNWRPISLTNTDYKILAKCIANRLSTVLSTIISENQVGFVKGRNVSSLIRTIDDTIETLRNTQNPGILLAIDYKRAFDSISKEYMLYAFKSFGFGDAFMKWVQVLLANTDSSINYLGWISERFAVNSGIRQGCPFSPMAFIIGLELLSIKIRHSQDLQGIVLPLPVASVAESTALKILLYADDISLFLHDTHDLQLALNLINEFSLFSNLELNINKTEAMWLGSKAGSREEYGGIKWKSKLKILGVFFSNNIPASLNNENWSKRIDKIKELISIWSRRNLSISGKLCIIKTFLISQIVYIIQSLALPEVVLTEINTLLFRFLWKKKNTNTKAFEKVKRIVICNTHENGGLNMINIKDMQNSFLLSWAIKLLKSTNETWSNIPKFIFSKLGPDFISFRSNVNLKSYIGIDNVTSVFWKRVLSSWIENKEKLKLFENDHFIQYINSSLWNNKFVRYRGNCLYFKDWSKASINFITDIKPLNIRTLPDLLPQIGNKATRQFEYNTICTAIRSPVAQNIPVTNIQNPFMSIQKIPKPSEIRAQLVKHTTTQPCSVNFWIRKLNVHLTSDHWSAARLSTNEERLRLLSFKVLHNIYPTNILLHKMGLRDSNHCTFCRGITDYVEHFFFSCEAIRKVWDECQNYIFTKIDKHIVLTESDILLGYKVNEIKNKKIKFVNHLILITKMVISKFKYGKAINIIILFNAEVELRSKYLSKLLS